MSFSRKEFAAIAAAAELDPTAGLARLAEHFDAGRLPMACREADRIREAAQRIEEAQDASYLIVRLPNGQTIERDAPGYPTGHAVEAIS
jgi:hypothetical protein